MSRRTTWSAVALLLGVVGLVALWRDFGHRERRTPDRSERQGSPSPVPAPVEPAREGNAEPANANPETDNAGLRVIVVDDGNRPRPDVQVKLLLSAYPELVWTDLVTTDAAGAALFPDVAAGRAVVQAASGSFSRSAVIHLTAGKVTELRIPLPRGVKVEGHVRHVEDGPLEGLVLCFQRRDGDLVDEMQTTTEAAGFYCLTHAAPGRYLVWTPGSGRAWLDVPATDSAGNDLVFGVLCVTGTVRDGATARPIAGATLQIVAPFLAATVTDASGTFRFYDLPAGTYRITATKDGYAIGHADCVVEEPLPRSVEIPLQPAASLRLRVTDTAGRAVTGEHVYYARPAGAGVEAGGNVITDGSGWLTIPMAPGVYDLSVHADGYLPASQHIVIAAGDNTTSVKLDPREGVAADIALRGVVRDATTGSPVPGVTLRVDGASPIAVSDEQGEYRFLHQWTGKFSLFVLKDGYGARILRDVAVEKGACRVLDLTLEPAGILQFTVRDREGNPIEGSISLRATSLDPDRPFSLGTRVGPAKEGRLTYSQLLPGSYRLTLSGPGGEATVDAVVRAGTSELEIGLR